jgi:protein O-GlcNAc transferase
VLESHRCRRATNTRLPASCVSDFPWDNTNATVNAPKRNDPCPCGSGNKYKKCCLARASAPAEAAYNRAVALGASGALDEAMRCYEQALEIRPDFAEAHNNLGMIHLSRARLDEAARCFQQALAHRPDYVNALFNLAGVHLRQGNTQEAVGCYRQLLARNPADIAVHIHLGLAHSARGELDEAVACFERALALRPDSAEAWQNLGTARLRQNRSEEAVDCFRKALTLKPDSAEALHNLGRALLGQGRVDEAAGYFQATLALSPDAYIYSNWLMTQLYRGGTTPAQLLEWHRGYAERYEAPLRPRWPRHANTRDPGRRLRIGYVSPDLRRHSVASFIEPVLAHHDKSAVEVYAYYSHTQQDEVTTRLIACVDHWVPCLSLSDEQLAERILADRIDILVDLAGHTAGNRLPAFARKPAPVQVSYLGYPATTGLAAVDYRLCTADTDPPGQEAWHTETLYRLPRTLWCYRPPAPRPPEGRGVTRPGNGPVTLGSLNNLPKVSPESLALWARILQALPESRLVMTRVPDGSARADLAARLAAQGIAPARLGLHGRLAEQDYHVLLGDIDCALDPFPYTGTTTTCETLWRGIPVVTRVGATSVARSGHALLRLIGLEELAADDEAEYVRIAVALASDAERLNRLHHELPQRFDASPLRDERGLARDLEAAYRDMWRRWCQAPPGLTA